MDPLKPHDELSIHQQNNKRIYLKFIIFASKTDKRKHCLLGQQLFALTVLPVASTFSFVEHVQGEKLFTVHALISI